MGEIFSAAGQIAGSAIQASAIRDATQAQIDALERQREFVFSQLDPSVVGGEALRGDVQRARRQLALQAITDPASLQTRYAAESQILRRVLGLEGGSAEQVADLAAEEAIAGTPGLEQAKNELVEAALAELRLGATLPPDVQAELVQAGLERSGETVGAATGPRGTSGQLLRQILGSAGLNLQAQRQQRAAQLAGAASDLESRRQQSLATLFPSLAQVQLNTLQGVQSALAQSNSMVPEAGLSGSDIANLWLARVGATNQLAQQAANIGAAGGLGAAQAWQPAFGAITNLGASMLPSTRSVWGSMVGGGGASSAGSAAGAAAGALLGM